MLKSPVKKKGGKVGRWEVAERKWRGWQGCDGEAREKEREREREGRERDS